MKIRTTRRISQGFFLLLFLWFCMVTVLGKNWWQLRGWPVNWFLQLDPLVGLATILSTGSLYEGLLWGLATVVLTILLGRFFCGWVCPFGALHQVVGYLMHRGAAVREQVRLNRYHPGQRAKYLLLIFLLSAAAPHMLAVVVALPSRNPSFYGAICVLGLLMAVLSAAVKTVFPFIRSTFRILIGVAVVGGVGLLSGWRGPAAASLQTGLLDPLPLFYRSVNLVLVPLLDGTVATLNAAPRFYGGAVSIGFLFAGAVVMNRFRPRFFCRFVCPLGALFGIFGRFALFRIGKSAADCSGCLRCERHCEGACEPSGVMRHSECVLCMNCMGGLCPDSVITYQSGRSAAGEILLPDLSRRETVFSLCAGFLTIPLLRLDGALAASWDPGRIRPPGSLAEPDFLARCIKCGQCMRICPTNVIQPAGVESGLERMWTPVMNNRVGTSGCQLNCIACGQLCPTGAIQPLTLDRKLGRGAFRETGPVKIGTAFVDRGRCLPWSMNRPCIVCQENCPVSPKAISVQEHHSPLSGGPVTVRRVDGFTLELSEASLGSKNLATGDYYCRFSTKGDQQTVQIRANTENSLTLADDRSFSIVPLPGDQLEIVLRLQQPWVDPARCIGCGICEHECPVQGRRAIRVTAENESRERAHALLLS